MWQVLWDQMFCCNAHQTRIFFYFTKFICRNLQSLPDLAFWWIFSPSFIISSLPKWLWMFAVIYLFITLFNDEKLSTLGQWTTQHPGWAFNHHKLMPCLMPALLVCGNVQNLKLERIVRSTGLILSNFIPPKSLPASLLIGDHLEIKQLALPFLMCVRDESHQNKGWIKHPSSCLPHGPQSSIKRSVQQGKNMIFLPGY